MGKKRRMILIASLVMSMTAGSVAAATMAACSHKQPTVNDVTGLYYGEVGTKDCEIRLNGDDFTFILLSNGNQKSGTYTYDGTNLTLTFSDNEIIVATLKKNEEGKYVLTISYDGTDFVLGEAEKYTVTFKSSVDNSEISKVDVIGGKKVSKPADPKKDNYVFIGWVKEDGTTAFDFDNTVITGDTTIIARFVAIDSTKNVYTVEFDAGDGVTNPAPVQTINGVVYNLPMLDAKNGAAFAGWWYSDYDDGSKLTYKYEGQEIKANTTLYAVWDTGAPLVSVTPTGVKWTAKGVNNNYTVKITPPEGEAVEVRQSTTTYSYDFTQVGNYEITVTLGNQSMTVYHKNKALDKVSLFSVEGNILKWNAVENAERYLITVKCGNELHNHTDLDLGKVTQYDFSACKMQVGGIEFKVKAVADGYATSESEWYPVERTLDSVSNIAVDPDTEVITWSAVNHATSYNLKIYSGSNVLFEGLAESGEQSLRNNNAGEYKIEVTPISYGYNSPAATLYSYTKNGLAAPSNLKINGYVLSWSAVDGATGYLIKINDATYQVGVSETSYDFSDKIAGSESLTIAVRALSTYNSPYSEEITVATTITNAKYKAGKLTWNAVLGATRYEVQVNNDASSVIIIDDGSLSTSVRFTDKGEIPVKIFAYNDGGLIGSGYTVTVTVYEITLDANGGLAVDSLYLATGDSFVLPSTTFAGYDFKGWYDAAGGAAVGAKEITDGVFNGNSDVTYYAYWVGKLYTVTLNVSAGESVEKTTVEVRFGENFKLPAATNSDTRLGFAGWYTEPNGQGNAITDSAGDSTSKWNRYDGITVYARWLEIYIFNELADGTYSVQKGAQATLASVTKIRIPSTYNNKLVSMIEGAAFQSCSNLKEIEIPNTIVTVQMGVSGGNAAGSAFQGCSKLESVTVYEVEGYSGEVFYSSYDGALIYFRELTGETELVYYPYGKQGEFVIPNNVTYLPINVFKSCSLTKITIPSSVKYIGDTAFYSNSKLTEVVFESPEDKDAKELTLGDQVFKSCTKLVKVTLPKNLAHLSHEVDGETVENDFFDLFSGCSALAEVYMDGGEGKYYASSADGLILNTDKNTIIYCPLAKAGDYTIGAGITAIGDKAFYKCTKLTSITISRAVREIGVEAFRECTGIKAVNFLGLSEDADLTIKERAFYKLTNTNFKSVELSANLTTIEQNAFGYCTSLTTVTVNCDREASKMSYSPSAFNRTTADGGNATIVTVNIGEDVSEFDVKGVFGGTGNKLTTVNVDPRNKNYSSENGVLFNADKTSIVYYPSSKTDTSYTIPNSVTRIGSKVFSDITAFTSITIGKNVTEIAEQAFLNCTNLSKITFAEGSANLEIKTGAFENCTSLVEITLPERLISLATGTFKNCAGLVTVHLPASLTALGTPGKESEVFEGCTSFKNIDVAAGSSTYSVVDGVLLGIHNNVVDTVLYSPVMNGGSVVEREGVKYYNVVTLPSTITSVAANAFYGNSYIEEIVFTSGTSGSEVTLGTKAFYMASALKKVTLPVGLKTIGAQMFYQCAVLEKINIPYTVTKIEAAAFARCFELDKLTFDTTPDNVTAVALTISDGGYQVASTTTPTDANAAKFGAFANCKLTTLVLPARLTSTGAYTFARVQTQNLTIPAGFKTIGNYAFTYATGLKTVDIPSSVTSIGTNAFDYCSALQTVTFAASTGNVTLGNYAFRYCDLTSITLPTKLTTVGTYVFQNNKNLASIDLTNTTVTSLGNYAFAGCTALGSSGTTLVIPSSVTSLGTYLFQNCTSLGSITINTTKATTIGNCAFSGCTSLTSIVVPEGVTTIGGGATATGAFYNCTALQTVTLPTTIQTINAYAFNNCTSLHTITFNTKEVNSEQVSALRTVNAGAFQNTALTSFTFPASTNAQGITTGAALFNGCTQLTQVNLSRSVVSVAQMFEGCGSITTITIAENNANLSKDSQYMENARLIFNVAGTVIKSAYGPVTSTPGSYTIPEGITGIEAYAFKGQNNILSLVLPSTLTAIGDYAFQNCRMLKSISIKVGAEGTKNEGTTSLVSIGAYAFNNCLSLAKFKVDDNEEDSLPESRLPSTLTTIGNYAFSKCAFTSLVVPASVTTMGMYVFEQNTALTTVYHLATTFGSGTLSSKIHIGTYDNCVNLQTVYLNSTLSKLDATSGEVGPFRYCSALESIKIYNVSTGAVSGADGEITLPSGITEIPATYFQRTGIKKLNIPKTWKTIGNYAFAYCPNLTEIIFDANANGTIELGGYLFQECEKLTTVTNGKAIAKIGEATFRGTGVKNLDFPNCTEVGNYAFSGCRELLSIRIPKCGTIGNCAFSYSTQSRTDANYVSTTYYYYACWKLKTVELATDDGIDVTLGEYAFGHFSSELINDELYNKKALKELETINLDRVVSVGKYAFALCSLTEMSFPACREFKDYALNLCTSLTKLTLSSTVDVTIGKYSIGSTSEGRGCSNLQEIVNSNKIVSIDQSGLSHCNSLRGSAVTDENGTRYVLDLSGCTYLGSGALGYCYDLTEVVLNPDVELIDGTSNTGSFYYCTGLETVKGKIKKVGRGAFYHCESLRSIDLSQATYIGYTSFESCYALENVDLSSATEIGYAAFENCHTITEVDISKATKIGEWSFNLCNNLTTVTLSEDLTEIPKRAFSQCPKLVSIDLSNIIKIGEYAFSLDSSLSGTIDLSSVTSLGEYAFYQCSSIEKVELCQSLREIPAYAFRGCESLTSIEIPASVNRIGNSAFFSSGLEGELDISGVAYVGADAFAVNNLTKIIMAEFTSYIGNDAFGQNASLTEFVVSEDNEYFMAGEDGALYKKPTEEDGDMITLICYPAGKEGDVVISANTIIAPYAFAGCYNVKSVTLPQGITRISEYAFWWFRGEIKFEIPDTVTEIASGAFQGTLMTEADLPEGLKVIGNNAFRGCENLETVIIPEGVEKIGDYAFAYCTSLNNVVIPASVTSIGAHAFDGCTGLTVITLKKGLQTIGANAFYGCTSLESITIPDEVQIIGDYAFEGCTSLETAVFGKNVGLLGVCAFYGCVELTSVTFGDGFGTIDASAFSRKYTYTVNSSGTRSYSAVSGEETHLDKLTNITFEGSVDVIEQYAFRYCGVEEVVLPAGISKTGTYIFAECPNLKRATVTGDVTSMGNYIFYKCYSLENVVLGEGVTTTGMYAFYLCGTEAEELRVSLPSTLKTIALYAFNGCSTLKEITIPESVTSINSSAFTQTGISRITIPGSVSFGGSSHYSTFSNCPNLEEVILTEGITTLAYNMFTNCPKLTNITLPSTIATWGSTGTSGVFTNSSLKVVTLAEGLKSIGNYAFMNTSLEEINFPSTLTTINTHAFDGTNLKSVKIPASVTSYGTYAFANCTKLTNVEIEEGATKVYNFMFQNCTSITKLVIPKTVTVVGANAFDGWTKNQTIVIETNDGIEMSVVENTASWGTAWLWNCGAKIVVKTPSSVTSGEDD